MLLALQASSASIDDSSLDGVTLLLLVGFVVSLVALSALLTRRDTNSPEDHLSTPDAEPSPVVQRPPAVRSTAAVPLTPATPAWLSGVTWPRATHGLSDATRIIERLLEARQREELERVVALYSPSYRARFARELGLPDTELENALKTARVDGTAPVLRSVELVTSSGEALCVRAGYEDRTIEVYRFVRVEDRWLIDSIERA